MKYNYMVSEYNKTKDYPEKDKFLIVNLLTGGCDIFKGEARRKAKAILNASSMEYSKEVDFFINRGYIVENGVIERVLAREKYEQIIENKDQLKLVILVTMQCNFRCKYCCEHFSDIVLSSENQGLILDFLRENLHHYKRLQIEWFGGEPLLAADIIEAMSSQVLDLCKKNKVQYYSVMSTNGYYLDIDMFYRMKKCHVMNYQITIDGMKDTHDSQRICVDGKGSWQVIIDNLRSIKEEVKSSAFSIMLRTNITKGIFNRYKEYISFMKTEFGSDPRFSFIWRLAEDWGNISEKNKEELLCGFDEYVEVSRAAMEAGLHNRYMRKSILPGGRLCESGQRNALIIFPDGVVGKCARNEHPEISHIGSVKDLLINSSFYLNATLSSDKERKCMECSKFLVCLGKACPFAPVGMCGYEMENFDFVLDTIAFGDDSVMIHETSLGGK